MAMLDVNTFDHVIDTLIKVCKHTSEQAEQFNFVFKSYANIPAAQQYGITFWNISDKDSWLRGYFKRPKEYPLLFDDNYKRKPAYSSLINSLHTSN